MTSRMTTNETCQDVDIIQKEISKHLLMAAVSSAFAEILTFPIDTIKVYLQLQTRYDGINHHIPHELELGSGHVGMKSGHSHHTMKLGIANLYTATHEIYSKLGIRGYYRGYKPAVLRASLNNALSATVYKPVRKFLGYDNRDCPLYIKMAAGIITGSSTQLLAAPTDLLKVRLQADATRDNARYHGFADAIIKIYSEHGWRAFWKGLGPSMCRAGFSVAATLGTYDHSKSFLLSHDICKSKGITDKDIRLHLVCSIVSGFFATLFACPFDVVKTRYQSQSLNRPIYLSSRDCLANIVKNEGLLVLFKGFVPMYARLGPWQISFFIVFEFLHKQFLGKSF
eukprot:323470_1